MNFFMNFQTSFTFDSSFIVPRLIGALPTNNTDSNFYRMVGWGDGKVSSKQTVIAVNEPKLCDATKPQVYCSTFDRYTNENCKAIEGSPVIGSNDSFVSGVLMSSGTCEWTNGRYLLEYHSVGEFEEWIKEVSCARISRGLMKLTIFSIILLELVYLPLGPIV
jgi:hypothetical protein